MRVVNPQDQASTYAAVLDALPISAFMAGPKGEITYLSRSWEEYSGHSARAVVRDGFRNVIHPDDRDTARAKWLAAQGTATTYRDEYRMRFADGSYRWVLSQAEAMRGLGGAVIGWFGTLTDIDDLKRAEAALSDSEAMHRAFTGAIPGVTWAASPQGDLTYVGDVWEALHGKTADAALGEAWIASVHPADRERVLAVWSSALASGDDYDIQFRVRVADGSYRWFLVRALPVRDDAGEIVRWVGVNVDIDDQKQADAARERFVRLAEATDDLVSIADENGNVTYVNEAGRRMLGFANAHDLIATSALALYAPEDVAFVDEVVFPAIAEHGRWSGELRLHNVRSDERIPVAQNVFTLRDRAGERLGIATISRDIRERRRVEAGFVTLAETGAAMFASLDYEQTLRNIAIASVRSFATYCVVDILADGGVRNVAAVHANADLTKTVIDAVPKRKLRPAHPTSRALFEGLSTLIQLIPANWVADTEMDPSAEVEFRRLAPRSLISVPMRAGGSGAVVGSIQFVVDARDPRGGYTADDLRFAEEIALRAGIAFDHARAYQRERRIAVTLQEASLPKTLPVVAGLTMSAEYRPGKSEAAIGGDWYDAFVLDDGRVVVTVGDVLGNGLDAAVTMSKVRQAMRSATRLIPEPNAMLDVADRTVRDESADTYATAVAGILDPRARTFTFASAGHASPIVRYADGRIEEFASLGIVLGLREPGETRTVTIALPAGSSLVFFTDGLVEATRDLDQGYERLRAAIADAGTAVGDDAARTIVEHVLAGSPATDDIAVLVISMAAAT